VLRYKNYITSNTVVSNIVAPTVEELDTLKVRSGIQSDLEVQQVRQRRKKRHALGSRFVRSVHSNSIT